MTPERPPTTVVKVSSAADILGVLPHRLGFHPTESLVVVSLHGPRLRDELVMRFDLPRPRDDAALCEQVVARLRRHGAAGTVLVCYTEAPVPAHGLARAPLYRALRRDLRGRGIEVVDALLVRAGRWWSYQCTKASCCPAEGTPLPTRPTAAALAYAAEAVARGVVLLPNRAALRRSVEAGPVDHAARWEVEQGLTDLVMRFGPGALDRLVVATVETALARWADGDVTLAAGEALTIALGIRGKHVRDRVMTLVLDHDPTDLAPLFTAVARHTPDEQAAAVCSALAWFAYAGGQGALALVAAERALRVEPGYEMAELIVAGLQAMQPPSVIREISALVRADLDAAS